MQLAKRIGATCSLNVTGACALGTASWWVTRARSREDHTGETCHSLSAPCRKCTTNHGIASYTRFVTVPRFDVVGIGENSVDLVYRLPGAPAPNAKFRCIRAQGLLRGTGSDDARRVRALGLQTTYVGTFGDDASRQIRHALTEARVDLSSAVVRHAPNRHAVILVDERNGDRTVVWHRDQQTGDEGEQIPATLIGRRGCSTWTIWTKTPRSPRHDWQSAQVPW